MNRSTVNCIVGDIELVVMNRKYVFNKVDH